MLSHISTIIAGASVAAAVGVSITPHEQYSSSVGVLGCKINTNRVAYWPMSVGCDNICVQVTAGGRSVNLLHIDQSGGAYDISYDAWNYLSTGQSATTDPTTGGGIPAEYEFVDASNCADLIHTPSGGLPLSASNSIDYLASCLSQPSSFVAQHYTLYNILNPTCTWGVDETCTLDLSVSNQPSCASQLGAPVVLTSDPVTNIAYGTGKTYTSS
jgi:hypothetical protein